MPSPNKRQTADQDDVFAISRRLCDAEVVSAERCGRSGNNRVYCIRTARASYALKHYGAEEVGENDRIGREFEGLRFLNESGLGSRVPMAVAVDRRAGFALYEWVEGAVIVGHGTEDIAAVVDLLGLLHGARRAYAALALPLATEAVLSGSAVLAQIASRLARLRDVSRAERDLAAFLADELQPEVDRQMQDSGDTDRTEELAAGRRTLSPSDLGFHNALRRPDNSLTFIDFEYFGWDDPVKVVADFLWHPAMRLSAAEQDQFLNGATRIYGEDPTFASRLRRCFPLYGIRWILIILNEFLPQIWERRAFAGGNDDWEAAKQRQLRKARSMLAALCACPRGVLPR